MSEILFWWKRFGGSIHESLQRRTRRLTLKIRGETLTGIPIKGMVIEVNLGMKEASPRMAGLWNVGIVARQAT